MKTQQTARSAPARRNLARRLAGEGGSLNLSILTGLAVFIVGLLLALLATATPQTSIRMPTRNLDADVYPAAPVETPTATPCALVGSWTEQAPYPIAVSGHAM